VELGRYTFHELFEGDLPFENAYGADVEWRGIGIGV
jgi:hypothetical protein